MHVGGSIEHSYDVRLYLIIVTDINKMWDDTTLVGVGYMMSFPGRRDHLLITFYMGTGGC